MKKIIGVLLLVILFSTGVCFAETDIPNLVGTWAVQSEGTQLNKGDAAGNWSHYRGGANALTAELIVTKQQGRVLYATIVSNNKMTYIYRHVGEKDSVVAIGIMTRKDDSKKN